MTASWIAGTLIVLGVLGALFRRQAAHASLNFDVALLGVILLLLVSPPSGNAPFNREIAGGLLLLILLHQLITFALVRFLDKKLGTTHLSAWRNLRG